MWLLFPFHTSFSFDGIFSSGQKREVFKREREVWAGLHFLTLDAFFTFLLQPPLLSVIMRAFHNAGFGTLSSFFFLHSSLLSYARTGGSQG